MTERTGIFLVCVGMWGNVLRARDEWVQQGHKGR